MAQVGRLRLRGQELVVEGMAGEILAKVEPDDHMRVVTDGFDLLGLFGPSAAGIPRTIYVSWTQVVDEDRGYIDVDVVDAPTPALPPPTNPGKPTR